MLLEAQASKLGGTKLGSSFLPAVEQLARELIAGGFAPLRRMNHPDKRELLAWGILSLANSPCDGTVQTRLLNEPADSIYKARHGKWASRITACDPRAEDLADMFSGWQVRKKLGIYGSAGEAAAMALKERLTEAFDKKSIGPAWRAAFCRWLLIPLFPASLDRLMAQISPLTSITGSFVDYRLPGRSRKKLHPSCWHWPGFTVNFTTERRDRDGAVWAMRN